MRRHFACHFGMPAPLKNYTFRGGVLVGADHPSVGTMKVLEARLADDGTPLHGIAISTRGRRYRWFAWDDGHLSIDREEEPLRPGGTHWRCVGKRLGEAAIKAAIRAAVGERPLALELELGVQSWTGHRAPDGRDLLRR